MSTAVFCSVILATYNWPSALEKVLTCLQDQSYCHFEIIIADDGSDAKTKQLLDHARRKFSFSIKHVWQPDKGFQAAKIRNKAAALAKGDYLVFLDGDCMPLKHFLARHVQLAQKGWFVTGNRVLLSKDITNKILNESIAPQRWTYDNWIKLRKNRDCNRVLPLLFLPFWPRRLLATSWKGAKTCNFGVWKQDFINVNGFDESYTGWGYEDSDLSVRLLKNHIKRKDGRFALPVIHLWHQEQPRVQQDSNYERLQHRIAGNETQAMIGVKQYLGEVSDSSYQL